MKMRKYWMLNGFHNRSAAVIVPPNNIVSAQAMRRAARKLCGHGDCTCGSSMASDPRPDQGREGIEGEPGYLERCEDDSAIFVSEA
jgi:hypothetical protein